MTLGLKVRLGIIVALSLGSTVQGFELVPMTAQIQVDAVTQTQSSFQFEFLNTENRETEIQIEVVRRLRSTKSRAQDFEVREPSSDFVFEPRKLLLKPNSSSSLTLHYRGPKTLTEERAYRLIARELKGDLRLTYVGSIFVGSSRLQPNLQVSIPKSTGRVSLGAPIQAKVQASRSRSGEAVGVEIEFENKGRAHQNLAEIEVKAHRRTKNSNEVGLEILDEDLEAFGKEVVLPKAVRRFHFHLSAKVGQAPLQVGDVVEITFAKSKLK